MTGYQEILTDPSYSGQIVTLTYPHIGNTGTNAEDHEAAQVYASGLIIRDLPLRASNFRMTETLEESVAAWQTLRAAPEVSPEYRGRLAAHWAKVPVLASYAARIRARSASSRGAVPPRSAARGTSGTQHIALSLE